MVISASKLVAFTRLNSFSIHSLQMTVWRVPDAIPSGMPAILYDWYSWHTQKSPPGTADFTVALWVRFNHTNGEQVLIEKGIQRFSANSEGWILTRLENNVIRLTLNTS